MPFSSEWPVASAAVMTEFITEAAPERSACPQGTGCPVVGLEMTLGSFELYLTFFWREEFGVHVCMHIQSRDSEERLEGKAFVHCLLGHVENLCYGIC